MRMVPTWIVITILALLVISFQNCSTLTSAERAGHESAAANPQVPAGPPTGKTSFWVLAASDELVAPEAMGTKPVVGKDSDERYADALVKAQQLCTGKMSTGQAVARVAFSIETSNVQTEGHYVFDCSNPDHAVRQTPSDLKNKTTDVSTGKVAIRYPEFGEAQGEATSLYQPSNELRFLTARLLAQDQCGHVTESRHVVHRVEFEVQSNHGTEGKYRIDCKQDTTGAVRAKGL